MKSKISKDRYNVICKTNGVVIIFSDHNSIVNSDAFWLSDGTTGTQRGQTIGRLRNSGELFTIEVVLDGVFSLDVRLDSLSQTARSRVTKPCWSDICDINVPSGRVAIITDGPQKTFLSVAPGRYKAAVEWSAMQESRHYDVPSVDDYPEDEGPDGDIFLNLLS